MRKCTTDKLRVYKNVKLQVQIGDLKVSKEKLLGSDRADVTVSGLLFTRPFCPFGINLNHVILKHGVI